MMPRNQVPMPRPNVPAPFRFGPRQMGMGNQPFNPMMGMGRASQGQMSRGGGGLLARLLGRGGKAAAGAGTRGPGIFGGLGGLGAQQPVQQGGSLLRSLANPASINGFLTNTQKVLSTAQQVGPMIQQFQQYGPIIKNLPAMWKLYRGLKNEPEQSTETEEGNTESTETQTESLHATKEKETTSNQTIRNKKLKKKRDEMESVKNNEEDKEQTHEKRTSSRRVPAPSVPKLYI